MVQAASRGFQGDSEAMESHEGISLMRLRLLRDEEKGLIRVSLAIWQLPLLLGNTIQINQSSLSRSSRIAPALAKSEQFLRQASAAELDRPWQQFIASGGPGLKQPVNGVEQKREVLLATIKSNQRQVERTLKSQADQARLAVVRDSIRRLALCLIYGSGFFLLGRSLG